MTYGRFRIPLMLAGAAALTGLAAIPTTSAAVRHGHAGGVAVHRPAIAAHGGVAWRGGRRVVSGGRVAWNGGHYGYGWRRYGWTGGVVGVGVSYGYPHYHHSCWWYRHYAPYNTPSWCGYAYGPAYSYVYASGPAYGGWGGDAYRRHYGWAGSTGAWTHTAHFAGMTGAHFNRMGMGAAHGASFAAIPHGGMRMGGGRVGGGKHIVH